MRPVKPGDLLIFDSGYQVELLGVVIEHHDDVALPAKNVWEYQQLKGPGASIYWQTSNTMALWSYVRLTEEIVNGKMKLMETNEP